MQYDRMGRFSGECGMMGCHGDECAKLVDHVETPAIVQMLCEGCLLRSHRIKRNSTDVYDIETGEQIPLPELWELRKRSGGSV